MSAEWRTTTVISACSPAPESGTILLPMGDPKAARRVLAEGADETVVLFAGKRTDHGTGACVSASTLEALGGNKAAIRYRDASFFAVLRRDRWMTLQLGIAILTLVGALLAAYGTWITNGGEASGSFANKTAVFVFAIATLLAFSKFVTEYRKL